MAGTVQGSDAQVEGCALADRPDKGCGTIHERLVQVGAVHIG